MAARHDLVGNCGLQWEDIFWGEIPSPIPCKCGKPTCTAELSFNWGGMSRAGEQSIGTVYFTNPRTGEMVVAGSSKSRTPKGWLRHTTTTYHETQVLEKKLRAQDYEKSTIAREQIQAMEEMRESYERSQWRNESSESNLRAISAQERENRIRAEEEQARKEGIPWEGSRYRPKIQDDGARARLAKDMAAQAQEEMYKRGRKWGGIDTGVHLAALHYDERKR